MEVLQVGGSNAEMVVKIAGAHSQWLLIRAAIKVISDRELAISPNLTDFACTIQKRMALKSREQCYIRQMICTTEMHLGTGCSALNVWAVWKAPSIVPLLHLLRLYHSTAQPEVAHRSLNTNWSLIYAKTTFSADQSRHLGSAHAQSTGLDVTGIALLLS